MSDKDRKQLIDEMNRTFRAYKLRMVKSQQESANTLNGVSFAELMRELGVRG